MERVNIPIGLAKDAVAKKFEAPFITYIKLRIKTAFARFNYKDLSKYLNISESTCRRHIKKLKELNLVRFDSSSLVAVGCSKVLLRYNSAEDKKVVSVRSLKKIICAKYILIRSELRKQKFKQDEITKYSSLLENNNVSFKKKKKIRKRLKSLSRTNINHVGRLETVPMDSYVGMSYQKVADKICRSKSTAKRTIRIIKENCLIKTKQAFLKSSKIVSSSQFKHLKNWGEIPAFSRLFKGYIYIQRHNMFVLLDNQFARI